MQRQLPAASRQHCLMPKAPGLGVGRVAHRRHPRSVASSYPIRFTRRWPPHTGRRGLHCAVAFFGHGLAPAAPASPFGCSWSEAPTLFHLVGRDGVDDARHGLRVHDAELVGAASDFGARPQDAPNVILEHISVLDRLRGMEEPGLPVSAGAHCHAQGALLVPFAQAWN
jgi:hypothetical protein